MKAEAQAPGVLTAILESTRGRVALLRPYRAALERAAARAPERASLGGIFEGPEVAVIAEVKRRSPSAGGIRPGADAAVLAARYAEAGAAAISVLTEPERFGGSLDDLKRVATHVTLPLLRKDFIIDPVQLFEAKAAGASAVLLIVRAVAHDALAALAATARNLGLATLIEIHDAAELAAAIAARPVAIGVNARDLETLAMDPVRHEQLVPLVPGGIPVVAESGLQTRADVERVAASGADGVLVGTALAGSSDVAAALRPLTTVLRRSRGS